jgi:hypothetical protein
MLRTMMSAGVLTALVAAAVLTALGSTDAIACRKKTLSAAEQARESEQFEARRKVVQAGNIRGIERVLAESKMSAPDRSKLKGLRDEAVKLRDAGKLDDADLALWKASKLLGHPKWFVSVHRPPHCR